MIITPSANPALLQRLLGALERDGHRVVVVANTDDAALRIEVARAATAAGAEVLVPTRNLGFSGACNAAARLGRLGEHVVLLNDDLVPRPGLVQRLLRGLALAGIVGAKLYRSNGSVDHAGTCIEGRSWRHISRDADGIPLVQGVTFAAVAIDRYLWDQLGGLNEKLWYACEDQDFCLRALRLGYDIRCDRAATAVHDQSQTRRPSEVDQAARAELARQWDEAEIAAILASYTRRAGAEGVET